MTAPVPLCGGCESDLRMVGRKWVCGHSDCPLYGLEQPVWPTKKGAQCPQVSQN